MLIKSFRRRLSVIQNIQYLIFGQVVPEGGFKHQELAGDGRDARKLKTLQTLDLKNNREDEL